MNYQLLPEEGVKTDFNNWNSTQNRYDCKGYKPKRKPPVKLVRSVIREFEWFCKNHHIDFKKYVYIQPVQIEGEWRQFDFLDSVTEKYPATIHVSGIISNDNGKIFQRIIEI